jgi:CRISPR-associated endonuclease/helicase Cas3
MLRPPPVTPPDPDVALPADQCFAKTRQAESEQREAGISVSEHGRIVGIVTKELTELYPQFLRDAFSFHTTPLLGASHDIGKVCPPFQEKLRRRLPNYQPNSVPGLENPIIASPAIEKQWGWHATVSAVTLKEILQENTCANIVGRHHGYLHPAVNTKDVNEQVFGGRVWQERRKEIIDDWRRTFGDNWPVGLQGVKADAVAGLITVADWIGSGQLFDKPVDATALAARALREAGFLSPKFVRNLRFADIFGFSPNAMQEAFAEMCQKPGLYLLEAPMGLGKTEAALYAAYHIMANGLGTGLYFALPTQMTSNKIHERVNAYLQKILQSQSGHHHAWLLHAQSSLENMEIGQEGEPGHSWFNSTKRAILAPFGVGTLDQALLSALPNVKHCFVRTFGLLGKVVVMDEIHSYDAYTTKLILDFLKNLRELHCTVIILSATLTAEKRRELLGLGPCDAVSMNYPLISAKVSSVAQYPVEAKPCEPPLEEKILEAGEEKSVRLIKTPARDDVLRMALDLAAQGQQVLWIENTVQEAQDVFKKLRSAAGDIPCGLLHSRFIQVDRVKLEEKWTAIYGKEGQEARSQSGHILVGTQVLEQSLDIDADCLITALCPMDMLLQRMGRLWRHAHLKRPPNAVRQSWVLLPELSTGKLVNKCFGKSGNVYAPYILARTLECVNGLDKVDLPTDIRPLLERVYERRHEKDGVLEQWQRDWQEQTAKLNRLARWATMDGGTVISDDKLGTRYSDQPCLTVLLVEKFSKDKNGLYIKTTNGEQLVLPRKIDHRQRRRLAATLMRHTVSVPENLAPSGKLPCYIVECLRDYVFLGYDDNIIFQVACREQSGKLLSPDKGEVRPGHQVSYSPSLGYSYA